MIIVAYRPTSTCEFSDLKTLYGVTIKKLAKHARKIGIIGARFYNVAPHSIQIWEPSALALKFIPPTTSVGVA